MGLKGFNKTYRIIQSGLLFIVMFSFIVPSSVTAFGSRSEVFLKKNLIQKKLNFKARLSVNENGVIGTQNSIPNSSQSLLLVNFKGGVETSFSSNPFASQPIGEVPVESEPSEGFSDFSFSFKRFSIKHTNQYYFLKYALAEKLTFSQYYSGVLERPPRVFV